MVCEVAEGALQFQGFAGEGAGGGVGAGVFVQQPVKAGGGFVSIVSTPHAGSLEELGDTCSKHQVPRAGLERSTSEVRNADTSATMG